MKTVKWYIDPQVIVNAASFLTLVFALLATGEFSGMISAVVLKWLGLGLAVVNIYIRVFVEQLKVARSLL